MIATHLARKSSYNNNNQYIQRHTPNYKKFYSLMDICVSWILLIGFLIWKSILIFGRIVMEYGLHLINWTMKHRNGGKTFKSIESSEVSIQSALGKE